MSLPSATLALLASLLVIGCATNEPQPTAAEAQVEKKDLRQYNVDQEGRIP